MGALGHSSIQTVIDTHTQPHIIQMEHAVARRVNIVWIWRYVLFFAALFAGGSLSQILYFAIGNYFFMREKNWEKDIKFIAGVTFVGSVMATALAIMGRVWG